MSRVEGFASGAGLSVSLASVYLSLLFPAATYAADCAHFTVTPCASVAPGRNDLSCGKLRAGNQIRSKRDLLHSLTLLVWRLANAQLEPALLVIDYSPGRAELARSAEPETLGMSHSASLSILTLATVFALAGSSALFAGGDQNGYGNPIGDPAEDTYLNPYLNQGGGRTLVYCADGESMAVTPVDDAAVEIACEAAQ